MILVALVDSEALSFGIIGDNIVMELAMSRLKHLRVCGFFDTFVVFILQAIAVVNQMANVQGKAQPVLVVLRRIRSQNSIIESRKLWIGGRNPSALSSIS